MSLTLLALAALAQEPRSTAPVPEPVEVEWALREPETWVPLRHIGFDPGERGRVVDLALASGNGTPWLFLALRAPGTDSPDRVRARRIGDAARGLDVFEAHAGKVLGRLVLSPLAEWVAVEALSADGERLGHYARDLEGDAEPPRLGDLRWVREGALGRPSPGLADAARASLPRPASHVHLGRTPSGATVLVALAAEDDRSRPWIAVSDDGRRFEGHFELPPLPGRATAVTASARGDEYWIVVATAEGPIEVLAVPLLRLRGAPMIPFAGLGEFRAASEPGEDVRDAWLAGPLADVPPRDLAVRVLGAEIGEVVAAFDPGGLGQLLQLVERVGPAGAVHGRTASAPLAQRIAQHVAQRGLGNVLVAQAGSRVADLPAAACDRVLLGDLRARLLPTGAEERRALASALFAALRPGGRLVCVDAGSRGLRLGGWRTSVEETRAVLASAGFEIGAAWVVRDATPQPRLVLEFRKPGGE